MLPDATFTAIVLSAQRTGAVDPLAAAHNVSHKCVVPIGGKPLIVHAVEALLATPGIARVRIVVEPAMDAPLRALLPVTTTKVDFVPAADNLADSVFAATAGVDGPLIVTTADNVLLTPGAVTAMLRTITTIADVGIAMATKYAVLTAHPEGQRRFYRFADDEYSNCNLYGFAGAHAIAAAESFRSGGQFAKKPMRLLAAVGVVNVVLMLTKQLSLKSALARLGKRFKLRVAPVVLADGSHAIDVDNERTYNCAALLLEKRAQTGGIRAAA